MPGNQVENLGKSVEARYFELLGRDDYQIPEDGYHGKDIIATAQRLLDEKGESLVDLPEAERPRADEKLRPQGKGRRHPRQP